MMNNEYKFIILPIAIKVLQHDKKMFSSFKTHLIYYSLIDSTIEEMQRELNRIGYKKIKQINKTTYQINDELVEFDTLELKHLTSGILREYFNKVKVEFEEKAWEN